tara:strand:- start:560 stop:910 length:351 start_codon:yes stop_codon:yes gene_type:complete
MSFNYGSLESSAEKLLQRFGRELTFTRTTDGTYSPNTGTVATTSSTYKKFACVFDYTDAEIGNGNVEQGDRRVLAQGHTYEIGDTVSLDSETYRIISISNIQPADIIMACNLQVRK